MVNKPVWIALAVIGLCPAATWGQSFTSLSGSVSDASGAAIPGAIVEIENQATSAHRSTESDRSGLFSFAQVPPGDYRLVISSPGFSVAEVEKLSLLVNTPGSIAISLEVGAVTETVNVSAELPQVNAEDASLGNAVTSKAIIELPFEARNPAKLLALQAGVSYFGEGSQYGRPRSGASTADRLNGSINGSKPDQNNITLDGVDTNDHDTRNPFQSVLRVTLDSVQEFRTTTQNPTADQGRGSGAQIALVTRSGTNQLHGSLYEYHRNTVTSANSFFNNRSGVERQKLIRNTFGASLGGAIVKDRLFYFGNFEGRRDASDSSVVQTVPTETLRTGNIVYLKNGGGTAVLTPDGLRALDPAGIGVSDAVLTTLNQYPAPNDDTVGDGFNTAGYRFTASTPVRLNTYITKLDFIPSAAHTVFLRGNLQNDRLAGTPQFPGQPPATVDLDNSKGLASGITSVLRPTLVNSFRYGFTRSGHETTGIQTGPYVSLRGISNLTATTTGVTRIIPVHQLSNDLSWNKGRHDVRFGGVVRIINNRSSNYATSFPRGNVTFGSIAGAGNNLRPADMAPSFSAALRGVATNLLGPVAGVSVTYNLTRDGDVLPFGAPLERDYEAKEYEGYINDNWKIRRNLTINTGLRYSLAPAIRESNGNQVSPTIDLVDWFETRIATAYAGISQDTIDPLSFVLADSPQGRPLYDTPKTNFSPRLSIAYSPGASSGLGKLLFGGPGKSSIRAGFGMYYDLFGMSLMREFDSSAPGLSTNFQTPTSMDLATTPRYTTQNHIPESLIQPPPASGFPYTPPTDPATGFSITNSIDQRLKQPYTMNMNLSIGRELKNGLFIQASYVSRLSRRSLAVTDLATPLNLREPNSGVTYWDAVNELMRSARAGVPASQIGPNPFFETYFPNYATSSLSATQGVYANVVTRYPTDPLTIMPSLDQWCGSNCSPVIGPNAMLNTQYASLYAYRSIGKGYYHAMQWNLRKRFSEGVLFDFNYTYGKSIDLTSASESEFRRGSTILNAYNTSLNKGVSDFDVTHTVAGYGVAELPFGKGKPLFREAGGLLNALIGGWQLGGVMNVSSGLPRSVRNSGSWPTNWSDSGYASQVGPVPDPQTTRNAPGINGVAGPNVFADPGPARAGYDYTYAGGIGQRNGIRGDGYFSVDMNLNKRFVMPYKESHTLQLRWEVFNVTNSVRFDVNGASLDVANTGTFGKYSSLLTQPRVMQFGMRY